MNCDRTLGMKAPNEFGSQLRPARKKAAWILARASANDNPIPYLPTSSEPNPEGRSQPSDPKLIKEQFYSEIDLIIDAGIIPNGKASTIYKLTNSKFSIIRS